MNRLGGGPVRCSDAWYDEGKEAALTDDPAPSRGEGPDQLLGQLVVGKYKVLSLIAQGGMGRIYRAEQIGLGRTVALKVLNPRYHEVDPQFEKRFLQEAETCGKLRSPNTVVVYDHGRIELEGYSTLFMAMEYIDGPTLRRVLAREGRLPERRAVNIAIGIARSLREAHKAGIVHRDLKPSNLILINTDDGESVKVVDFGVAKVNRSDVESLTMADRIIGSPRYMAPEQIRHQPVDGRADIYALGVLMFEMLAGESPFKGEHAVDTLMLHLTSEFPTIHGRSGRTIAPELESIIRKCTEKAAEQRYPHVGDLLRALIDWQWSNSPGGGDARRPDGTEMDSGSLPTPRVLPGDPMPAPAGGLSRLGLVAMLLLALTLAPLLLLFTVVAAVFIDRATLVSPPATELVSEASPSPPVPSEPMPIPLESAVEPVVAPVPPQPVATSPKLGIEAKTILTINSNRRALAYVNDTAVGYVPVDFVGRPGTYVVAAMLPGQPDTRQTREVVAEVGAAPLLVTFEFAPVATPPPEVVDPEKSKRPDGRRNR